MTQSFVRLAILHEGERCAAGCPSLRMNDDEEAYCAAFLVHASDLLRLLDMASRAVSESTVRKLKEWDDAEGDAEDADPKWRAFTAGCYTELRPSAEALARSAGEEKP